MSSGDVVPAGGDSKGQGPFENYYAMMNNRKIHCQNLSCKKIAVRVDIFDRRKPNKRDHSNPLRAAFEAGRDFLCARERPSLLGKKFKFFSKMSCTGKITVLYSEIAEVHRGKTQ